MTENMLRHHRNQKGRRDGQCAQHPSPGALDLVSLGALVHRLDPGIIPFRKAAECQIHVSGGEYNVAANLSDCFRMNTAIATAMVEYPIGDLAAERVKAMGVKPFYRFFKHNGVNGPNIAAVYSDRGRVFVLRWFSITGATKLQRSFVRGILTGRPSSRGGPVVPQRGDIRFSLGDNGGADHRGDEGGAEGGGCRKFRSQFQGEALEHLGGEKKAADVVERIVGNVDVLVGMRKTSRRDSGSPAPKRMRNRNSDPEIFLGMMRTWRHGIRMSGWRRRRSGRCIRKPAQLERRGMGQWQSLQCAGMRSRSARPRGGGDGFASGFIYGLLSGEPPEEAVKLGWAHGALLTTFPGDTTMATLEQVRSFAGGGSARIQR